jgi:hypothetical protein
MPKTRTRLSLILSILTTLASVMLYLKGVLQVVRRSTLTLNATLPLHEFLAVDQRKSGTRMARRELHGERQRHMLLQSQRIIEKMRSGRHITVLRLHIEEGDTIQLHARDPTSSDSDLTRERQ